MVGFFKVDSGHDGPTEWAVLIVWEPSLDALLMEEVFVVIAWHSHDVTARNEVLAAHQTLL